MNQLAILGLSISRAVLALSGALNCTIILIFMYQKMLWGSTILSHLTHQEGLPVMFFLILGTPMFIAGSWWINSTLHEHEKKNQEEMQRSLEKQ